MAVSNSTDRFNGVLASKAIKVPCKVATSANITLSGTQTIDGVLCNSGDRVLVRAQTNAVENGIWIVQDTAWYRAADWDGNRDVTQGTLITAFDSAGNASQYIVETADPISIGNTAMSIILYSQGATVAVEAGTVANAAMRWDGVDTWRQAQRIRMTAQGADFQIYNAAQTHHMNVEYEATGINFTISDPTAYFSFASDVSIDGADFFVTGVAEIDRVIAGDPGTEGTGISVNGTNYTSALKVSDLGDTHLAEFILHRHSLSLPATIVAARAASADSSHVAVGNNSHLFLLAATGWDGATYQRAADISVFVDGVPGASDMPGRLTFSTTPDGGFSPLERMRLGSGGTMYLQETATADADLAGKGQIFVRSDTPNVLVFRDDAGTEVVLGESNVVDGTAQGDLAAWDTVSGKYQPTNDKLQRFDDGLRIYADQPVAGQNNTNIAARVEFWDSDKDSWVGSVGFGDNVSSPQAEMTFANYMVNGIISLQRTNFAGTLVDVLRQSSTSTGLYGNGNEIYFYPGTGGGAALFVSPSGYIQAEVSGLQVFRTQTQAVGGLLINQTYNNNSGFAERALSEADLQAGYRLYMGKGFGTTATDPGASLFKWNNADYSLATEFYISATDEANWDADVILGMQSAGDLITVSDHKGRDEYLVMKVTGAPTDNLGWWTIPVEYVKGVTNFTSGSSNDPFIVEFAATSGVTGIADGTAEGNTLYWDNTGGSWVENDGLAWDETNQRLKIGANLYIEDQGTSVQWLNSALELIMTHTNTDGGVLIIEEAALRMAAGNKIAIFGTAGSRFEIINDTDDFLHFRSDGGGANGVKANYPIYIANGTASGGAAPPSGFGGVNCQYGFGFFRTVMSAPTLDLSLPIDNMLAQCWRFNNPTAAAEPGTQFMRANTTDLTTITAFYFDEICLTNINADDFFSLFSVGDILRVSQRDQFVDHWGYYEVTSITDNTTWWTVGVTNISAGDSGAGSVYSNGQAVHVQIIPQTQLTGLGATSQTISTLWAADLNGNLQAQNGGFMTVASDGIFRIQERTTGPTAAAGYGYLWVKDDVAQKLYFRDDTGTDFELNAAAGTIGGTIADNQIAFGNGTDTIAGSANLTWDDTGVTILTGTLPSAPAIELSSARPVMVFNESDGAVDNRRWYLHASAERFEIVAINDANSASESAISIERTGNVIDSVDVTNGDLIVQDGQFKTVNTEPYWWMRESDASVDEKNWRWRASAGNLYLSGYGDDDLLDFNVFQILRTAGVVTEIDIQATKVDIVGDLECSQLVYIAERAAAGADIATYGQIWVNSADSQLYFTTDGGTDYQISNVGGGSIGGSITDNQVAVGAATSNNIEGSASLTWDGSTLLVTGTIANATAEGAALLNETPSTVNPTVIPRRSDVDTGLGSNAADQLSLIAGSIEFIRIVESTNNYISCLVPLYIEEQATANPEVTNHGQIWVKSNAPNELWFTDDTGVDIGISKEQHLHDYSIESSSYTPTGTTQTLSYPDGPAFEVDLESVTGNITITLSNAPASGNYGQMVVKVTQDSTVTRSITWAGGTFEWAGGTAHPMTSTLNGWSIFTFETWDGGTTWYGAGADYS